MGVGVGLTAGPSTAAVVEFCGQTSPKRAALITMVAQAAGFAAALLLGGALTEYAPWPTRLTFWLLAVLLASLMVAAWFLPPGVGAAIGRWRPSIPSVPKGADKAFTVAALAITTAYTHGVLILSIGEQVAHDLVRSSNGLVNGAVLALFAIMSCAVGIVGRSLAARSALIAGSLCSAIGMGLLAWAVRRHDPAVFLLATATAGAGYSLLFLSALEVINAAALGPHRGGVLSAVYLLAYLSLGSVALVLGEVATLHGLDVATDLGAAVITALSLGTLASTLRVCRS